MKLNDIQKWRIENLAKFGFADRFIAAQTHDKPITRVTKAEIQQVTGHRTRHRLLLSLWRLGESVLAKAQARSAILPKAKQDRKARRKKRQYARKAG